MALRTILVAALLLSAAPASAWRPETRVRITDEAVRLMPETLRIALESHREALLRGVLTPMIDEDTPGHGSAVDASVEHSARELSATLAEPTEFNEIAARFGRLAHFVGDAGFPPAVGAEGDGHYAHFSDFCESRREKFPLVFYGHDDAELDRGDFAGFARRMIDAARGDDRRLVDAYARAGNPPDPAAFDDRSVPFAVGSLAYSRTVTDTVRAWLAAWRVAGGDMRRTPYWKLSTESERSD